MTSTRQNEAEQREHARLETFEYALAHQSGEDRPKRAVIVNLGLGGIQLRCRERFEVGSMWNLQISGATMPIPVEVRYFDAVPSSDLFAVGMRFKPGNHEERMAIAKYVHNVFQQQLDNLTL
jgi:hypothetical protein